MAFRWWANNGSLLVVSSTLVNLKTKQKIHHCLTLSDKTFWIRACFVLDIRKLVFAYTLLSKGLRSTCTDCSTFRRANNQGSGQFSDFKDGTNPPKNII